MNGMDNTQGIHIKRNIEQKHEFGNIFDIHIWNVF